MIDVIYINDKHYVNIDDFINHLNIAAESVIAFTSDAAPNGARMVSDTLYRTIETLENLKVSDEN
jgi:hypothetical protein